SPPARWCQAPAAGRPHRRGIESPDAASPRPGGRLLACLAVAALLLEAARAVHWLVAARHERHSCPATPRRAPRLLPLAPAPPPAAGFEPPPPGAPGGAPRGAALRAASGLVGEALLRVDLLLSRGEQETAATLTADQGLVGKRHGAPLLETIPAPRWGQGLR